MSRKVSKNYNSLLIDTLAERGILFNSPVARVAKSAVAGLFMSQLLFWWKKGSNPNWIYKTIHEFEEETVLNRSEQDRAIKIWKKMGVLTVEKRGIPPKRHFHIDTFRLERLLREQRDANLQKSANRSAKRNGTSCSNVQNTTESTQENTSRDLVLQTLRRPQSFDISAASKDLANKFSINKSQKT